MSLRVSLLGEYLMGDIIVVLFAGGLNQAYNFARYRNDIQLYLDTFASAFNCSSTHVRILHAGGGEVFTWNKLQQSVTALDATPTSLKSCFAEIASITKPEDTFLFLASNHGGQLDASAQSSKLYCWNESWITDDDLRKLSDLVNAKTKIFILGQCYSGGFVRVLSSPSSVVVTACAWNEVSYATVDLTHEEFLLAFATGLSAPSSTLDQAFKYAVAHDGRPETPQLSDPAQLGLQSDLLRRPASGASSNS
jgi:hypothetical protein